MSVEIVRGVERIVRFRDIVREDSRVQSCFVPLAGLHRFCQLLAIHADLPGKKSVGIEFRFSKFGYRGFVLARQSFERESSIFVEKNEMFMPLSGRLGAGIQWIGNMLRGQ